MQLETSRTSSACKVVRFGRFQLDLRRRDLLADGASVPVGSRAIDVLKVLIEARGQLVTKDQLLSSVWRGAVVEESALQAQISILRRALGPDRELIRTIAGRGYLFTADIATTAGSDGDPLPTGVLASAAARRAPPRTNLPTPASVLIGREAELAEVEGLVAVHRAVTLVGAGGIGKTRLSIEVAWRLLPRFPDGIWVAELAPLSDPDLVLPTVAVLLGVPHGAASPERLAAALASKRLLLLLDNCEHVIDAAAQLAEALERICPNTHILSTSRENLRIEGEHVHRVRPLDAPPAYEKEPDKVLGHSAVQLCIERTRALQSDFSPDRESLLAVGAICRHLDGIPLAIEFAAARAATIGVRLVASNLGDRFALLTDGRRTALPRHQTLRAVLDWSYELLPELERRLLLRLAIFPAGFTLNVAIGVVSDEGLIEPAVVEGTANLVAKSLVTLDEAAPVGRFRLLETIRSYALERLDERGELERLARRHAEYHRELLQRAEAEWEAWPTEDWLGAYAPHVDDVRAALDWAYSSSGDTATGASLTVAALPLWFEMSLLEECRSRAKRALADLMDAAAIANRQRMQLYAAIALSQMYTVDSGHDTISAWMATLKFAQELDDTDYRLRALFGMYGTCVNTGEFHEGLAHARQFADLAASKNELNDQLVGERLIGAALHFIGDQVAARQHIERMLTGYVAPARRSHAVRFQSDQRVTGSMYLARVLWLLGFPDEAMRTAELNVDRAVSTNHSLSLCNALAGAACPVALLVGDLEAAEKYIGMLLDQTARDAFDIWHTHGVCFEGELLARRGDLTEGLLRLRAGVARLVRSGFGQYLVAAQCALADTLWKTGQSAEALDVIDDAIERSKRCQGLWYSAELLRVRGVILQQSGIEGAAANAEGEFLVALDLGRQQHTLALELRVATNLAQLRREQGRIGEAYDLLWRVHDQFSEGHSTSDLKAARRLLMELSGGQGDWL